MPFWIQVSDPRSSGSCDPHARSLGEALESAFPLHTENAYLVWNHIHVPLSYRYDLSVMAEDLLGMLDLLSGHDHGAHMIAWPSNTFRVDWSLAWHGPELTVRSRWECVVGNTERLLQEAGDLSVDRHRFLGEWGPLLDRLHDGLVHCGYRPDLVAGMADLERTRRSLTGAAVLYPAGTEVGMVGRERVELSAAHLRAVRGALLEFVTNPPPATDAAPYDDLWRRLRPTGDRTSTRRAWPLTDEPPEVLRRLDADGRRWALFTGATTLMRLLRALEHARSAMGDADVPVRLGVRLVEANEAGRRIGVALGRAER